MVWVKKSDLPKMNTVNDLLPLLQVMEDDNLTEFQYVIENGKWNVIIRLLNERNLLMGKLNVDGTEIQVLQIEEDDYISLTDMVRKIDNGPALIEKWLRNKNTIEFLGIW